MHVAQKWSRFWDNDMHKPKEIEPFTVSTKR
ncbi:hypothetical protein EOA22_19935 [Mesorhizobium sp. M7A.F.Ca.US.014.04.1.1]|nr:hypothetical protein EOC84_05355 [Mesorhizobium sp. Primo-B]RUU35880.1 hypothetical protein EOC83_23905 [Mesorhizobium sp. Primo-A]RUX11619.1 hypothetical protein EN996_26555 [Mesorhizobium sp. M7A.F.Ca.CA.002.14.1.2]RUX38592.1 hypothetical protein EN987_15850 [Mesorhizobium sp. M7A.F.Ca.CA.002.11.2.1]RUX44315.1 hypothetical protein EN994_27930 [Mesorhizobium sp. M7A.F.Ca.CA.002.09.1.1]RUX55114.1 hypothetical protein EN989_27370 [Mesorhizobium sp. M7A.F.Ca.CA.002.12.1.1]RUX63672.1 hypothet